MAITPYQVHERLLDHFGKQSWWPGESRFEVVIGALLVQRTMWRNVEKAITKLKKDGLLAPCRLARAEPTRVEALIRPVGFYRQKARRIIGVSKHIVERYGSSLERFFAKSTLLIRDELLSIDGVGPETADAILLYAADKPVFPVGAYTRRVFERMGVEGLGYEELQSYIVESLPLDLEVFKEFHALLVKLGKTNCKITPICLTCSLLEGCEYGQSVH